MAVGIKKNFVQIVFNVLIRNKHSDRSLIKGKRVSKHWNNESLHLKALEKREKLIYDSPDENEKFNWKLKNEENEVNYDDFAYNITNPEILVENSIKKTNKWRKIRELKTIERKYFRKEVETNLLTYEMKEKIRYLHENEPETWNLDELSKAFPISRNGIKKLLKAKFVLNSREKIIRHDLKVAENWRLKGVDGGPISTNSRKISFELATKPIKIGYFTSILAKTNPKLMEKSDEKFDFDNLSDSDELRNVEFDSRRCRKFGNEREMTADEFRNESKPKMEKIQMKKNEKSFENNFEYVEKYKNPKFKNESNVENVGKRLGLVGDTFYDENGQFLYRIYGFKIEK